MHLGRFGSGKISKLRLRCVLIHMSPRWHLVGLFREAPSVLRAGPRLPGLRGCGCWVSLYLSINSCCWKAQPLLRLIWIDCQSRITSPFVHTFGVLPVKVFLRVGTLFSKVIGDNSMCCSEITHTFDLWPVAGID